MNIIFLEAVQNFGGARKSTVELAKRLQDKGNTVSIIDFWGSCTPFVDEAKRLEIPLHFIDKRNEPIILSHSNKFKALSNYVSYFFKWIGYRKKLAYIIKTVDPDLIIVNNVKTLSILKRTREYKIGYFARGWFLPHTVSKIDRLLIKKTVDIFLGVSQSTRQAIFAGEFAKLKDIYVVPNAIDFERLQELKKSENALVSWDKEILNRPFIIMHCGGFLQTKGQEITIDIAKSLKKDGINFKVLLVGIIYKGGDSQKYYEGILKQIKAENLEDYFSIILNESDVLKYFMQMDVLVHPSATEGLPRVVMEAMALGKPVIGNAVGGMTDYISHGYTGYLTNYNSVEDYIEYCTLLQENKQLYSFMSNNASELIRNSYTTENQVNQLKKINFN